MSSSNANEASVPITGAEIVVRCLAEEGVSKPIANHAGARLFLQQADEHRRFERREEGLVVHGDQAEHFGVTQILECMKTQVAIAIARYGSITTNLLKFVSRKISLNKDCPSHRRNCGSKLNGYNSYMSSSI